METETPEHDRLTLLVLVHLVVLVWVPVIFIIRSVAVVSLSPPLHKQDHKYHIR